MKVRSDKFERRYRLLREVVETIALTVLMFLVIRLAVQNFNIDGESMEPNLHNQELVLVDKWSYLFQQPARGDIVIFQAPPHPDQDYVKRIIGLPGDVVSIDGTTVTVNGVTLNERYIDPARQGNPYGPFANRLVPADSYLVLGDNRADSSDSRAWGCVPRRNIIGRAAFVYWPIGANNYGSLPSIAATFAQVRAPSRAMVSTAEATNICPIINQLHPSVAQTRLVGASARPSGEMMSVGVLFLPGLLAPCCLWLANWQRDRRDRRWQGAGKRGWNRNR